MKKIDLLARIEAAVQKYKMFVPGERILIACSGGADSVALSHLLKELAPRLRIRLGLIHFDHRLRRGSEKDSKFVKNLARHLGVPFYSGRRKLSQKIAEKGLSPEESARKIRYKFFEAVARKTRIKKIALAHHQDDQAETVLMRLLQGTGLRGLQGIRPMIRMKGITFVRPLMGVKRVEIRDFLKKHSLAYREDATNRSVRFLRNRIRHRLLPFLEKEFNPQIRQSLCRLAETTVRESLGLDEWVTRQGKTYIKARKNGMVWLDRERFLSLPGALQFRLLDQILHLLDLRSGLDFESWERIEEGFRRGRVRMTLPRNLDLRLTGKRFTIQVCLRPRRKK